MKLRVFQCGVHEDCGKEFYVTVFTTKHYSLLQVAFDYSEYSGWVEWPHFQISMGYGRLFSFFFSMGRLGFTFDIASRNWRDETFYDSGSQVA